MTTAPQSTCGRFRRVAPVVTRLIGLGLAAAGRLPAADAAPDPKDHVLFVGTDLDVKEDGKFYHVVGATKDSLKIEKGHEREDVRLGRGANLRVSKGVKLSSLSAQISDVKTESVDRASARAQLQAMQASMMLADEADMTADRLHGQMVLAGTVTGAPSNSSVFGAGATTAAAQQAQSQAATNYTDALPGLSLLSDSANTFMMQRVADAGQSEVRMSFDVSSPVPIEHPYLIVIATYAVDDKPDQIARQVSAQSFDRVDGEARHVTMSHAASLNGLPFKKFDIALFANGQEVATNLSDKRMALTTDQAYEFFLIDYLSAHKGATLPPTPMLMTTRPKFRRALENLDANQPVYVTVDKLGKVLGLSTDEAGKAGVPAGIEAALQHVRFMPALKDGAPMPGRVRVTLGQLAK